MQTCGNDRQLLMTQLTSSVQSRVDGMVISGMNDSFINKRGLSSLYTIFVIGVFFCTARHILKCVLWPVFTFHLNCLNDCREMPLNREYSHYEDRITKTRVEISQWE